MDNWIENGKNCIVCPKCNTWFHKDDRRKYMVHCPYCGIKLITFNTLK